jgi:hypothetical protein
VKEFMVIDGKNMDELCSINLSEESVKGIKPTEAELKEEITRFKSQALIVCHKVIFARPSVS